MTCKDCIHEKVCLHYIGRITGGKVADPSDACADNCYLFDAKPKQGEWRLISNNGETSDYECSACLGILMNVANDDEHDLADYCPMCGARMDGGKNDD